MMPLSTPFAISRSGDANDLADVVVSKSRPVDLDGDGAMDVVSCSEGRVRTIWVHWAPSDPARYRSPEAWKTERWVKSRNGL